MRLPCPVIGPMPTGQPVVTATPAGSVGKALQPQESRTQRATVSSRVVEAGRWTGCDLHGFGYYPRPKLMAGCLERVKGGSVAGIGETSVSMGV